ncbi:hypothetical protein JCM6882_004793 [Rhodosporidiobolus microsporus]
MPEQRRKVLLVAAAPSPVTWYAAPTVTPSSLSSTKFATVWYKADPTPSSFSSSSSVTAPSSSAAPPASTAPIYSGPLSLNSRYEGHGVPPGFADPLLSTGTESDAFPGLWYAGRSACPEGTLGKSFRALSVAEKETRGIAVNEAFYSANGSLRKFCGKQIQLTNPLNASSPALTFTVTRGTPSDSNSGAGVGLMQSQVAELAKAWGWTARMVREVQYGGREVNFRFL